MYVREEIINNAKIDYQKFSTAATIIDINNTPLPQESLSILSPITFKCIHMQESCFKKPVLFQPHDGNN